MKFNREKNHVQKYKLYFYTNIDNLINNTKKNSSKFNLFTFQIFIEKINNLKKKNIQLRTISLLNIFAYTAFYNEVWPLWIKKVTTCLTLIFPK